MRASKINELVEKVETLAADLISAKKENARLKRLLAAAEEQLSRISDPEAGSNASGNGDVTRLTRELGQMKEERKIIRAKVEKMAAQLDRFYE